MRREIAINKTRDLLMTCRPLTPFSTSRRIVRALLPGLLLALAVSASAQVPTTMSYQGRLVENTADQDAATGSVDIVFSLWSDPSGGTELWTESWTGVPLSNGIFSVLLGSNGSPFDPADFQGDTSLYLQLEVDGETLSPRQMLGSSPFAVVDQPDNELQDLDLSGHALTLSGDPTPAAVDLSPYLDDTDDQDLSLSGHTLSLTNDPSPVNLGAYQQTLDLAGNDLTISGSGSSVDLSTTTALVGLAGRVGQLEGAVTRSRKVFATSNGVNGAFGGIAAADARCQNRADAAGLGGRYLAWLSDSSTSPASRFDRLGSFQLVDGTMVADNWADLTDGTLDHAISMDEYGNAVSGLAWTGTRTNGTASPDTCEGWTVADSTQRGYQGDVPRANPAWTYLSSTGCHVTARLYCFEQTTPSLDDQVLSLVGNDLRLTSDDGPDIVSLAGFLDNTDNQELSLSGSTLSLTSDDGTDTVDLAGYLDNTDAQDLALSGHNLVLTNDPTPVDLGAYEQTLDLTGDTLAISGSGSSVDLSTTTALVDLSGRVGQLEGAAAGPRKVFATSTSFNGDLGGIAGANALCQSLADAAGLGGQFLAWLSDTSSSPASRFDRLGSFQLVDGTTVADDWADLTDGTIDHAISLDEYGNSVTGFAWTDTRTEGTLAQAAASCQNWTSSSPPVTPPIPPPLGYRGDVTSTSEWTLSGGLQGCDTTNRLYCFEGRIVSLDNQTLSLSGNILSLTSDDGTDTVDLSPYLDNTDHQALSLSGNALRLTSHIGTYTVDLTGFLDNTDNQDIASVLANGTDAGDRDLVNLNSVDIDRLTIHEGFDCDAATADCITTQDIEQNTILGNDITNAIYATYVECNGECTDITANQACDAAANALGLAVRLEPISVSCFHKPPSSSANGFVSCNNGSGNIGDNECSARAMSTGGGGGIPCLDGSDADAIVTCLLTDLPR